MTPQDIAILRLHNQRIIGGGAGNPLQLAKHMGAMQAQDYYGALWAIGLRTGQTEKEVIKALKRTEIVRTWPQRGTLHVVPADDAKWLVGLSADRLLKGAKLRREQLELDDTTLARSKQAVVTALRGGKLLSRPKMMETLEQAGISTKLNRGYHILWYLSQTGITFIGPMEGKQQTFGLLDEWVPRAKLLSRTEGIAELTKRYFTSHGPATIQDFIWWAGLTTADAKAGLEANLTANRALFDTQKVDGKEYWFPKTTTNPAPALASTLLLPGFDEYMLGYKDRSAALHADHTGKIVPGGNGMFLSTIVINGQVVGTWKRTIKKDHVLIIASPFRHLSKADMKLVGQAAERYGRFLGLPAKVA